MLENSLLPNEVPASILKEGLERSPDGILVDGSGIEGLDEFNRFTQTVYEKKYSVSADTLGQNRSQMELIKRFSPIPTPKVLFDSGCGNALSSIGFIKFFCPGAVLIGEDVSLNSLRLARRKAQENEISSIFVQGDIKSIPLVNDSVDLAFSGGSINYLADYRKNLSEIFRILRKGGVLVLTSTIISLSTLTYGFFLGQIPQVPVLDNLLSWQQTHLFRRRFMSTGYYRTYLPRNIITNLKQAGFRNIESGYIDSHISFLFLPSWLRSLAVRVEKTRLFWSQSYFIGHKD